ncbi:LLM class flavin-dependent oxidoreductase [Nonomuraea sp. NBC_01738]|uniref:LLM class flavin-dependent oxidoreductase n=1 Tax=Nonomuraea sp. NBC_01738 TaxID=2976003 RepID=UPI002E14170F|nr:LLM class flavin-dependent oxidoreductase [Nonomuraea sp. NBC_01738]
MRITYAPWGETLGELTEAAGAAQDAGAEVIWLPELHRSATVSAAAVAAATSGAGVGSAIALAFTRSPMITALEALDLDELTGGRFVLGLGSGARRLNENWHNADWERPLVRLRETVEVIRMIIATAHTGEPLRYEGETQRLDIRGFRRPYPPVRERIPIYLAAVGPQLTRLAGRIGDGWISHELASPAYLREHVLPNLEPGPGFDVVVSGCCSIADDPAVARREAAGVLGFYASVATYKDFFAFHGLAEEHAAVVSAFRSGVAAAELARAVPERMIDPLVLAGTPDQVAGRIAAYEGLATTIKLSPAVYGNAPDVIRACQARVIALIKELT